MQGNFGQKVKELRQQKRMTQSKLSDITGISRFHLSMLENGKHNPRYDTIEKIAKAFDISVEELEGQQQETVAIKDMKLKEDIHVVLVPVVGEVRAGVSMYAQDNIIDYRRVNAEQIKKNKTYFYLKVVGDSMDKIIKEGDLVLVEHTTCVDSGDIVIALVNEDEATIKRIKLFPDSISLIPQSNNPIYKPHIYNNNSIQVIGKVIKAERFF